MTITIDTTKVEQLVKDSDKILLTPEAEQTILELLELQEKIDDAIKEAKEKIAKTALELDPAFTSIKSDNMTLTYQAYGRLYKIDETKVDKIPKEVLKVRTTYDVDREGLAKYLETHKGLPDGLDYSEREKQIVFRIKKGATA